MPSPLLSLFTGGRPRPAVLALVPRRTLDDVVLPPRTRRALEEALAQVRKRALIFDRWGLGERHATGLGLAFNFAGPPGTGKTICAEAIARELGMNLVVVDYAEMESMWMGETPKNIAAAFRAALENNAVLLFDEADAIASRRSAGGGGHGYEREANVAVNVLLRELEAFNGVVIFATNLASSFDPAFERRLRSHVLFEMPGAREREQIWRAQVHPRRTPLGDDVDFAALAARFEMSGGDIKNAVIKAASAAAAEPGADAAKRIHQRHFERAAEEVLGARAVMRQSLLEPPGVPALPAAWSELPRALARRRFDAAALVVASGALAAALLALAVALSR